MAGIEEETENPTTEAETNILLATYLHYFPLSVESSRPKKVSGTTKFVVWLYEERLYYAVDTLQQPSPMVGQAIELSYYVMHIFSVTDWQLQKDNATMTRLRGGGPGNRRSIPATRKIFFTISQSPNGLCGHEKFYGFWKLLSEAQLTET
jgi:hypothetical protein